MIGAAARTALAGNVLKRDLAAMLKALFVVRVVLLAVPSRIPAIPAAAICIASHEVDIAAPSAACHLVKLHEERVQLRCGFERQRVLQKA